jgi:hypothetical protein
MKKIMIATPTYSGKLDAWYVNSLVDTIRLGLTKEVHVQPVYVAGDALVQKARSDLMRIAVEAEVDHLIWIDDDMEWDPQWVFDLVESGKDVIGGTARKKIFEEAYVVNGDINTLEIQEDGLMEVNLLGTGFLHLSKKAIDYLWEQSTEYIDDRGVTQKLVTNVEVQDGRLVSEDYVMCRKLKEGGFKMYLDTKMTCGHIGSIKFSGDFASWFKAYKESTDKVEN